LKNVDQGDIINFIEQNIIFQFGILETFTMNQGIVFTSRKVVQYVNSQNIRLLTSTHYYAQANDQAKAINKILISLIKKHVGQKPRNWHESLDQVLWAYRNSPKGVTGVTLFKLVYRHKAILPIEINLNSIQIQRQNEIPVQDYWDVMYE